MRSFIRHEVITKLIFQALVLAPTRELAQQIQKVVIALGDYMGAQCHACIGGTSVREDMRKLDAGQHIVVGKSANIYDPWDYGIITGK